MELDHLTQKKLSDKDSTHYFYLQISSSRLNWGRHFWNETRSWRTVWSNTRT